MFHLGDAFLKASSLVFTEYKTESLLPASLGICTKDIVWFLTNS